MEFIYYAILWVFTALAVDCFPISEGTKVNDVVWIADDTFLQPPEAISHRLRKREVLGDVGMIDDSEEGDDDSDEGDDDSAEMRNDDNSVGSNTGNSYYKPYIRIRQTHRFRFNRPAHPLSNYADSYDRFPTVF